MTGTEKLRSTEPRNTVRSAAAGNILLEAAGNRIT
jgi:hypothetical protein